jgi:diguanylate cyclase (GGDEF)-like protein/PAS domain S-box-containing protein
MEKKILRLLIVDDSPDDAEIPVNVLRKAGYMLKSQRVHDMATLEAALHKGRWDLVVSEYTLPQFSGVMALDMIRRAGHNIPFLILTREISDDNLQAIMAKGANDVVRKQQLARLLPSIKREIGNAALQAELYRLQHQFNEFEKKQAAIIESSRDAVAYVHDGVHVDANASYLRVFGFSSKEELAEITLMDLIAKKDQTEFKRFFTKPETNTEPREFSAVRKDGQEIFIEMAISPVTIEGESCVQVVVVDITKRQAVENKLKYLSQHDPLTGLFGRHYFMHELNAAVERIRKENLFYGLYYLNVDQLTSINEKLGYAAGDRLLLKISKQLSGLINNSGMVSRLGGDEFAVLIKIASDQDGQERLGLLQKTFKNMPFSDGEKNIKCSCSVSFVRMDPSVPSAQKALSMAYHACEKSKAYKQNAAPKAEVPTPSVPVTKKDASDESVKAWEKRIKQALDKDKFELTYQPVVSLRGETAELFEVLLRMDEGGGNLIAAGEFMFAAEKSGMIEAIDKWVIQHAVEALANMHADNRDTSLFINVSKNAFFNRNFASFVKTALVDAKVKSLHLIIEIDERDLMEFIDEGSELIRQLKDIGCGVSIDNFGTGLGTLEAIGELPIQYLKIKGSILKNINEQPQQQALFQIMLDLAKLLNKKTVAKSVENAEVLSYLWQKEIDFVQGFYFEETGNEEESSELDIEATLDSEEITAPYWTRS